MTGLGIHQKQTAFGELIRRLQRHLDTIPPDIQHDLLLYLA